MEYQDPFGSPTQGFTGSTAATRDEGLRSYMLRIYNYMASALALTGITALFTAKSPAMLEAIYHIQDNRIVGMTGIGWLVTFSPFIFMFVLRAGMQRMSASAMQLCFWAFAVVMGLSMTSIFLMYTGESIARTFFITAGTFGAMSLWGYTTKRDLTGMGSFMMMGVIGLIIAMVVNMFLQSSALNFAVSVLGVVMFTGLTASNTQMLKNIYYYVGSGEMLAKAAIMGALTLYLDFINIFTMLLNLTNDRR